MTTVEEPTRRSIRRLVFLAALVVAVALALPTHANGAFPGKNGKIVVALNGDLYTFNPDGSGLTLGRSVARFFSTWISGFIFCIGYIIAAFDDEKRSLHDRICETRVIRT